MRTAPCHLLPVAYQQLQAALRAQAEPDAFLDAVAVFLEAFCAIPGAKEELKRRAETAGATANGPSRPQEIIGWGYLYLSEWPSRRDQYEKSPHGGKFLADLWLAAAAEQVPLAAAALVDWQAGQTEGGRLPEVPKAQARSKRSTVKGEAREKITAALTKHHQCENDSCLNLEPIGNNELARLAKVDRATASVFFKREFGGHAKYKAACGDAGRLAAALKLLRGEYSPHLLYGGKPPGEGERDEEEEAARCWIVGHRLPNTRK